MFIHFELEGFMNPNHSVKPSTFSLCRSLAASEPRVTQYGHPIANPALNLGCKPDSEPSFCVGTEKSVFLKDY